MLRNASLKLEGKIINILLRNRDMTVGYLLFYTHESSICKLAFQENHTRIIFILHAAVLATCVMKWVPNGLWILKKGRDKVIVIWISKISVGSDDFFVSFDNKKAYIKGREIPFDFTDGMYNKCTMYSIVNCVVEGGLSSWQF